MSNLGKFITFEGPEGSGKSTHSAALAERMREAGRRVFVVREPGGTGVGERIREILRRHEPDEPMCRETELFLFLASRAQLVRQVILPALRQGTHVVCDRFADSTTAYQGYARSCDAELLGLMNNFAVDGLVPDLTILLDLDAAAGLRRVEQRLRGGNDGKDRIEREALEFHEKVRAGYLDLAVKNPGRFRRIDASRGILEVREDVWREVCFCVGE